MEDACTYYETEGRQHEQRHSEDDHVANVGVTGFVPLTASFDRGIYSHIQTLSWSLHQRLS
jgi:hypothetical protein